MFGHLPELVIILVVALIVFGPEKLPEVARTIGGAARDVRHAFDDAMRPEEEPVDFDAYYREYEANYGSTNTPDYTEVWPGVAGTEGIEMAIAEHPIEGTPGDHAGGARPVAVPSPAEDPAPPSEPA